MIRKLLASVLVLSMSCFGVAQAAPTLVTTGQVAASQDAAYVERDRALVLDTLQRADVQAKMQEMGVDPEAAMQRVAALTDDEIARLAHSIETDPAGGNSVLGFLLTIFIVLLVTDILGFTQVFPFVRHGSARAQ
ncbi:MAG: PA2779 family protein [Burkholderiales bacterium]